MRRIPRIGRRKAPSVRRRARLSGHTFEPRSIEAELRAAMHERTSGEIVVEVDAEKRWR